MNPGSTWVTYRKLLGEGRRNSVARSKAMDDDVKAMEATAEEAAEAVALVAAVRDAARRRRAVGALRVACEPSTTLWKAAKPDVMH